MMNRLANTKNPYQGKFKKVLAVCSAGLLRSPSIAWVLSNPPYECNTRACGVSSEYALIPIDQVLVEWADVIVCADEDHMPVVMKLREQCEDPKKPVWNLQIPDRYSMRHPALVTAIQERLAALDFKSFLSDLQK
jgi:predicted protein tyrosine phosphatase